MPYLRDMPASLDEYRSRFARNLLGAWSTVDYQLGPWPDETWEFYDDGTGFIFGECLRAADIEDRAFLWRETGRERTIEISYIYPGGECTDEHPADDPDSDPHYWMELTYDFKVVDLYSPTVVLFEVPVSPVCNQHFVLGDLHYLGGITADAEERNALISRRAEQLAAIKRTASRKKWWRFW